MTLPIVCSFGAGTQSSAIAQLVLEGRLPRPALWQFADTGEEPPSVYANLALWKSLLEAAGMNFMIVRRKERLSDHALDRARNGQGSISLPPMYVDRKKRAGREEHGTIAGLDSRPSLHKSGTPLGELDFAGAQQEMFGGWGNDCAGVCGV